MNKCRVCGFAAADRVHSPDAVGNGDYLHEPHAFEVDYRPEPPEPWEVLGFRRFTYVDWYGLAGAERFLDGSEPLVAYLAMDGFPPDDEWNGLEFVIDQKGIGVSKTLWGPDEDDQMVQEFRFIEDLYDARAWLEELAKSGKPLSWAATDDPRWASA